MLDIRLDQMTKSQLIARLVLVVCIGGDAISTHIFLVGSGPEHRTQIDTVKLSWQEHTTETYPSLDRSPAQGRRTIIALM